MDRVPGPVPPVGTLEHTVAAAHAAYQAGAYWTAAEPIVEVLATTATYEDDSSRVTRRRASAIAAAAYVLVSKIAAKSGDASLAWVTADRALRTANVAEDPALPCVAIYQVACALAKEHDRLPDARNVIEAGLHLAASIPSSPKTISAYGALELLAAVVSAKLGDKIDATKCLGAARALADRLGHDGNHLWTCTCRKVRPCWSGTVSGSRHRSWFSPAIRVVHQRWRLRDDACRVPLHDTSPDQGF